MMKAIFNGLITKRFLLFNCAVGLSQMRGGEMACAWKPACAATSAATHI